MVTTTEDIYNLIADVTHNSLLERHLIEYQIDDVIDDLIDELYMYADDALELLYHTISTESSVRPNLDQQQLFKTVFPTASANLEIAVTKIKERKGVRIWQNSKAPPCGDYKKHDAAIEWGNNCTECNDAFVESFK